MKHTIWSAVRGFNYQPGIGSSSYENWVYFDADTVKKELENGKKHFPQINTIRLWLSYDAFLQNNDAFMQNLHTLVNLCRELNLCTVLCLFNRWHNTFCDNDGLYTDHFIEGTPAFLGEQFYPYVDAVLNAFGGDDNVLLWDLCNEPFAYSKPIGELWAIAQGELAFLQRLAARVQSHAPQAPVGISLSGHDWQHACELVEPFTDVLLIHPYLMSFADEVQAAQEQTTFLQELDRQLAFAKAKNKPLLVTETCWGSVDDRRRCENMCWNLSALHGRNLGFLAHALSYSPVADLHGPCDGPLLADLGVFHFVEKDGALRAGHDLFNAYCDVAPCQKACEKGEL